MKNLLLPVLTTLVVAAAMLHQSHVRQAAYTEPSCSRLEAIPGYTAEHFEPSQTELNVLPKDTRFDKCVYTGPGGRTYVVSLVIGGHSKSSIHRPELCLPSQGYLMSEPHGVEANGVRWRALRLSGPGMPDRSFAYTFFNQTGFRTDSHLVRIARDVWDRSVMNRIDRWVMVTVSASDTADAPLVAFLEKLKEAIR